MIKWMPETRVDEALANSLRTRYPNQDIYISHGWIDAHVHIFSRASYHLNASAINALMPGVVGLVDAGSAGASNYQQLIDETQMLKPREAFLLLNLAPEGIASKDELAHLKFDLFTHQQALLDAHVIGTKVRLSPEATKLDSSYLKPLSDVQQMGSKLMAHVGNTPPSFEEVISYLKPGDVITHFYHAKNDEILKWAQTLSVEPTRKLPFYIDVGWGLKSFNLKRFNELMALGVAPDFISTDLHNESESRTYLRLHLIMSYFLAAGMTLEAVVNAVTWNPLRHLISIAKWPDYTQTYTFFTFEKTPLVIGENGAQQDIALVFKPLGFKVKEEMIFHD